MKKKNDSINHPLQFITEDGKVIGQFYNSWDKKYHLAEYIPYEKLPTKYLCGKVGNFSGDRSELKRNICEECFKHIPTELWRNKKGEN